MRRHPTFAMLGVAAVLLSVHLLTVDIKELFTPMVTLAVAAFAAGAYAHAPRTYWLAALLPALVAVVDVTRRRARSSRSAHEHAQARRRAHATVVLDWRPRCAVIDVRDTARGGGAPSRGPGPDTAWPACASAWRSPAASWRPDRPAAAGSRSAHGSPDRRARAGTDRTHAPRRPAR